MTVSQLNAADIAELNNLLVVNHDRGGFYLRYYELTGSTQALLQAHITTYSGFLGGPLWSGVPSQRIVSGQLQYRSRYIFLRDRFERVSQDKE